MTTTTTSKPKKRRSASHRTNNGVVASSSSSSLIGNGIRRGFSLSQCVLLSLVFVFFQQQRSNDVRFLTVDAFVTPGDQSRSSSSNGSNNHNRRTNYGTSVRSNGLRSDTTLHFFSSVLTNRNPNNGNNNDDDQNQEYNTDLPLARYVDVSANYTLAHTPDDVIDLKPDQRLVCVGDVHGDYEALKVFLETGGVYDPITDSWCGGDTIVVQCGDILDRGFEELACYQLLSKLSQQAPTQGGKVILLVGNHEALNAMGLFQYAFTDIEHEQTIGREVDAALGKDNQWRKQYVNNQPARWASYEPGGLLAHSLLRNMKVVVQVGGTVCVHAGLRMEHLLDHGGISGMNAAFRDWISLGDDLGNVDPTKPTKPNNPVKYNHHGNYPDPRQAWVEAEERQTHYVNSIPVFLQNGPTGPIWMRDYSSPPDAPPAPAAEAMLDQTLNLLRARRMVMGHTIQRRINGVLGGKAWRVDVGASRGCLGGTPEVLEVTCFRAPDGTLAETVAVLTPATAPTAASPPSPPPQHHHQSHFPPPQQQHQLQQPQQQPSQPRCFRIPAKDRLVDAFTQAAVEIF